jgi:hypothetical protein
MADLANAHRFGFVPKNHSNIYIEAHDDELLSTQLVVTNLPSGLYLAQRERAPSISQDVRRRCEKM